MEVHRIINNYQHSCTYILYENGCCYVWLVDCGSEVAKVIEWLHTNNKTIHGVFLTHCHDDHICGLKQILKDNPKIPIYLSAHKHSYSSCPPGVRTMSHHQSPLAE